MNESDFLLADYMDEFPPGSDDAVDEAWRKAAQMCHPDKETGSVEKFRQIQKEREYLKSSSDVEEAVYLDDLIGVGEIIESVYDDPRAEGEYELDQEVPGTWMGKERWTGILEEDNSGMEIHLDIDLPYEIEDSIEFEVSYFKDSEEEEKGEDQTSEISDYIESNNLNEIDGYRHLVQEIGIHTLQKAEEILREN